MGIYSKQFSVFCLIEDLISLCLLHRNHLWGDMRVLLTNKCMDEYLEGKFKVFHFRGF